MDFKEKRILVTGGEGSLGQSLIPHLVKYGFKVRSYDRKSPGQTSFAYESVMGDIRDESSLRPHVQWADQIIHLAAISKESVCTQDPGESYSTNVFGTTLILDLIKDKILNSGSQTPIFMASSSVVYGQQFPYAEIGLNENRKLPQSISMIAAQKKAAEEAINLYCNNFGLRGLSLRLFSVYPKEQVNILNSEDIVSRYFQAFFYENPIHIYGRGSQAHDFVSSYDVVRAFTYCLNSDSKKFKGQALNIASGISVSSHDLFRMMRELYSKEIPLKYYPAHYDSLDFLVADIGRARELLNWSPVDTLRDVLESMKEKMSHNIQESSNLHMLRRGVIT